MAFNSYIFVFLFLPSIVLIFHIFRLAFKKQGIILVLLAASSLFYGWANPWNLLVVSLSILANYVIGIKLSTHAGDRSQKGLLTAGVAFNLILLAYYKYTEFFLNMAGVGLGSLGWQRIIMPVGISFFTFQQIMYLVDISRGNEKPERDLSLYGLFILFFPYVTSGPIVRKREVLNDLRDVGSFRLYSLHASVALTVFFIGLAKKTILADGIAIYATQIFNAAEQSVPLTLLEAWTGALAYSLQLYFDFSGYTDMAIGLAMLFGVSLPENFNSPYKALNIIDFWRRWHISLSRFFREYLYIPLGGNRYGKTRQFLNLLLTMALVGFWHGAGWTFITWGLLHGGYLILNHGWNALKTVSKIRIFPTPLSRVLSWTLTFASVTVAWVFFRAESFQGAFTIVKGMAGQRGLVIHEGYERLLGWPGAFLKSLGAISFGSAPYFHYESALWTLTLLLLVLVFPNTARLAAKLKERLQRGEFARWAVVYGVIAAFAILGLSQKSNFLYFQF